MLPPSHKKNKSVKDLLNKYPYLKGWKKNKSTKSAAQLSSKSAPIKKYKQDLTKNE